MARKAGKCPVGTTAVEQALTRRQALLLLMDDGAGPTTRERFLALAQRHGVPVLALTEPGRLAQALGKDNARVAAITDIGFVRLIRQLAQMDRMNNVTLGGVEKE